MISKKQLLPLFLISIGMLTSCGETKKEETNKEVQTEETALKYKVYKADIAKDFPEATLTLAKEWESTGKPNKEGKIMEEFSYSVTNYELAKPTEGEADRHCAVSNKGQHIHFIVNNGPYAAMYEPNFTGEMQAGTNIVLSFLSRSYHESIKNGTAFDIRKISYGGETNQYDNIDLEKDHMLFYSRPKGAYKGHDTHKILLDFFLVNTDLSQEGYKVRATINGEVHLLDSWAPYFVEGLPMGENVFRLELIDAEGNLVDCAFSDSGDRIITLEEEEHTH